MSNNNNSVQTSPLLKKNIDTPPIKVYLSNETTEKINKIDKQKIKHDPSQLGGTSSISGVLWNFLNALVGAGILGIPFVYTECGIFGGIILMIVFALLCTYTLNLLIKSAQKYEVSEYEDLGYKAIGTVGYIAASACLFLLDFGSMLNYLIILGDAAFKVIQIWGFHEYIDRQLIIIIISMIIIFPPCLWRDISFYEKFSAIKLIAIAIVIIIVIYQWISYRIFMEHEDAGYGHKITPPASETVWFDITGVPSAMGIIAYCFVCHDTAFIYYNTLFNPTTSRWSALSFISIFSAMGLSLTLSIPAYLTFGVNVQGNVLNNYSVSDPTIIFTRIVYVITMALTYPTAFFVVRHVVYSSYNRMVSLIKIWIFKRKRTKQKRMMSTGVSSVLSNNIDINLDADVKHYSDYLYKSEYNVKNAPLLQHVIFTVIIFFSNLALALYIDNLGTAMSIIGSLSSVNLAFVLPCICYIQSSEYGFLSFFTESTTKRKLDAWMSIYPPAILTIFGLFIAIYGVVLTLKTATNS